MAIFRYEWRQLRGFTLGWALAVGVLIFAMLPVYYRMVGAGGEVLETIGGMGIFELLGVDARTLLRPEGVYGFLTAFFSIAGGICGMRLGLGTFAKETVQHTAEFTYTKPFGRKNVFCAKVLAAALAAAVIGLCYVAGSALAAVGLPAAVDAKTFLLVGFSYLWVTLFFLLFGALLGAVHPRVRTPLLLSSGVVFVFYVFSAYAGKVGAAAVKYFTPFSYFNAGRILALRGYDPGYLAAWVCFCVAFAAAGLLVFVKKDVTFVS